MLKKIISYHIENNSKTYIIIAVLFLIGVTFGVVYINNINEDDFSNSKDFFIQFKNNVNNTNEVELKDCLLNSFFKELKFEGIIFIITCTIILGRLCYLLVVYKGFSIGYVISAIIRIYGTKKGIVFSILTLLISNFICVPCIIIFIVYCINFLKKIKNKNTNIKLEFFKIFIAFLAILVISTFFEALNMLFSYKTLKKMQKFF